MKLSKYPFIRVFGNVIWAGQWLSSRGSELWHVCACLSQIGTKIMNPRLAKTVCFADLLGNTEKETFRSMKAARRKNLRCWNLSFLSFLFIAVRWNLWFVFECWATKGSSFQNVWISTLSWPARNISSSLALKTCPNSSVFENKTPTDSRTKLRSCSTHDAEHLAKGTKANSGSCCWQLDCWHSTQARSEALPRKLHLLPRPFDVN